MVFPAGTVTKEEWIKYWTEPYSPARTPERAPAQQRIRGSGLCARAVCVHLPHVARCVLHVCLLRDGCCTLCVACYTSRYVECAAVVLQSRPLAHVARRIDRVVSPVCYATICAISRGLPLQCSEPVTQSAELLRRAQKHVQTV